MKDYKKEIKKLKLKKLNFCFYLKTFVRDFLRVYNLLESFNKYNVDNINLVISCPRNEVCKFNFPNLKNIVLIADEDFASKDLAKKIEWPNTNITIGYVNQEICKLVFYKTGISSNYLCIDSDLIFIRNFYINDFMFDAQTPYTVLVQDKDLSIQRYYKEKFWIGRQKKIEEIYKYLKLEDPRFRTCHGMQVFNTKSLLALEKDFLNIKGLIWLDLIKISPYEFTWYNCWLQKSNLIEIKACEPFFKVFHCREEYIVAQLTGLRTKDYAHSYVGLVLNSGWYSPKEYKDPPAIFYFLFKILSFNYKLFLNKIFKKTAPKSIVLFIRKILKNY